MWMWRVLLPSALAIAVVMALTDSFGMLAEFPRWHAQPHDLGMRCVIVGIFLFLLLAGSLNFRRTKGREGLKFDWEEIGL